MHPIALGKLALDWMAANPWRAIAIAAIVLLGIVTFTGWLADVRADAAVAARDAAIAQRDSAQDRLTNAAATIESARVAGEITSASLDRVMEQLRTCQTVRARLDAEADAAAQTLQARLRDANAAMSAMAERYQRATRDPECSICLDRPICAALRSP